MRTFRLPLLLITGLFFSCCSKQRNDNLLLPSAVPSPVSSKPETPKAITDTLIFQDLNNDGDYAILSGIAGNETDWYVYDFTGHDQKKLAKGDELSITYYYDTIYIAGDGEKPELAKYLKSYRILKEGPVKKFRKKHKKPLKYTYSKEYSVSFLDFLYLNVEYYLAQTHNPLLLHHINHNLEMGFSVEETERDGKNMYMLGIYGESEHKTTTMQWLFYSMDESLFFEYDLANDILIPIK